MRIRLVYIFTILLVTSCSLFSKKKNAEGIEEDPIAKAYSAYLYPSDLAVLNFQGLTKEDSTAIAKKFIKSWVDHQVIVYKASAEGKIDFDQIALKAEELKFQLIRHEFERSLIISNLDTIISKEEIDDYYEKHQADFELKQNIVKCLFVKLHNNTPKIKEFKEAFFKTAIDMGFVNDYCLEYADVFSLNDTSWVVFDDIVYGSPYSSITEQIDFIQNTNSTMRKDKYYQFYLRILDYRLVNSTSPAQFHYNTIANIIYNQRKLELIKKVEEKLYKDALNEQEVEFYN